MSHPNIAAIFGLEELDGAPVLVMELVEGETLATRLGGRPVALPDALAYARQIVDALDYAHEKNVLHRDLKPANIRITPDGTVKLLDFGLARALDPLTPIGDALSPADSPTVTSPAATVPGTILGTAAYMAPEQVRGRPLDRRADIWAFGCVLYEMLTGRRAFEGETVPDTLAAVLKGDPDWTRLPATVPGEVKGLLRHCLALDMKARLRHIADARRSLEALSTESSTAATASRGRRWLDAAMGGALAAAVFIGWYVSRPGPSPSSAPVRRLTVQLPAVLPSSTSGGGPALTIARDGSAIAFTGRAGGQNLLYVHRLSDSTTTMVRGPANPNSPAFSADGKWVAFGAGGASAGFWRAATEGGEAEAYCSTPPNFGGLRGMTWSIDGRAYFGSPSGLFEAGAQGPCQLVLALERGREARFLWPQVLPGARGTLLTVSGVSDDADAASIVVVPNGSTERRVVVRGARAGRLTASGHLLFARGDRVLAAPFDLDRLEMTAEPVVVVDGIASGQFGGPLLDVSDRGDLVYVPGRSVGNRLVWATRSGERVDAGMPKRGYVPPPNLSPDGRWVAVSSGTADHFLSLLSLETGTLTSLTNVDTHGSTWSPDSRRIVYQLLGQGFVIKDREATGDPELLLKAGQGNLLTWAPDAATLVGSRPTSDESHELFALRIDDRTTRTLLRSRTPFVDPRFSSDGRWLAFTSNESGRNEVYVTDFPEGRVKKPVSTDGGAAPNWSRNGRQLFYLRGTAMMAAAVRPGASIEFERPVRLFDGVPGVGPVNTYSVAPDGRFLFVEDGDSDAANRSQLTLVLNWFEELRRAVPPR